MKNSKFLIVYADYCQTKVGFESAKLIIARKLANQINLLKNKLYYLKQKDKNNS